MASETKHTPGPWAYVAGTKHHGPYVTSDYGSTICDCYTMSDLSSPSVRNGGTSKPVSFLAEMASPNARLIAAAPDLLSALVAAEPVIKLLSDWVASDPQHDPSLPAHAIVALRKARAAIAKAEAPAPASSTEGV